MSLKSILAFFQKRKADGKLTKSRGRDGILIEETILIDDDDEKQKKAGE